MTFEAWVAKHPYLRPMNDLQKVVHAAAAEIVIPPASVPRLSGYLSDFHAGVPLLLSSAVAIDFHLAGKALAAFIEILASNPLPATLNCDMSDILADLKDDVSLAEWVIASLIEKNTFLLGHPGLLHYLCWTIIARHFQQVTLAFSRWREEECWLRNYCPMCGALPAMAQLVGDEPARLRLLSCDYCATRWRYRRTGCPFCDAADDSGLAVLAVEGETALRIDYCETCGGYLKTYSGAGSESVLLADWTSVHVDVIARERGLRPRAASLYEL